MQRPKQLHLTAGGYTFINALSVVCVFANVCLCCLCCCVFMSNMRLCTFVSSLYIWNDRVNPVAHNSELFIAQEAQEKLYPQRNKWLPPSLYADAVFTLQCLDGRGYGFMFILCCYKCRNFPRATEMRWNINDSLSICGHVQLILCYEPAKPCWCCRCCHPCLSGTAFVNEDNDPQWLNIFPPRSLFRAIAVG